MSQNIIHFMFSSREDLGSRTARKVNFRGIPKVSTKASNFKMLEIIKYLQS